jgi:hypothetical protein
MIVLPLLQSWLLGGSRGSAQSALALHDEVRAGRGVDDLSAKSVEPDDALGLHGWWREAYSRRHALSIRVLAGTLKNASRSCKSSADWLLRLIREHRIDLLHDLRRRRSRNTGPLRDKKRSNDLAMAEGAGFEPAVRF